MHTGAARRATSEMQKPPRQSASALQREMRGRNSGRMDVLDSIVDAAFARIRLKADANFTRMWYDVPPFVAGLPVYDVNECVKYVRDALEKAGYVVQAVQATKLYVSWDRDETRAESERNRRPGELPGFSDPAGGDSSFLLPVSARRIGGGDAQRPKRR